ncbi:MAG: DmsE family decaheme c-type cytochrome [Candidatus Binataceae bacterium]
MAVSIRAQAAARIDPPSASADARPVIAQPASELSKAAPEAAGPAAYVGDQVCESCHRQAAHTFLQTAMGKLLIEHPRDAAEARGCESCHGPGSRYVPEMAKAMAHESPDAVPHGPSIAGVTSFRPDSGESAEQQNAACLNCHNNGAQAFWRASVHAFRGLRCTDCHTIMRKLSPRFQLASAMESNPFVMTRPETQVCLRCHLKQKTQMTLPSHMPLFEGLMTCTDCHNPHGGPYPDQLVRATVNQTCYMCHAEKRGPFLWIHPPVAQSCLNCHNPHGSINQAMLKLRPPRLCQQCHIGTFHPGSPGAPGSVFVFGRSCTNCHSAIHGSNAPGGVDLTR